MFFHNHFHTIWYQIHGGLTDTFHLNIIFINLLSGLNLKIRIIAAAIKRENMVHLEFYIWSSLVVEPTLRICCITSHGLSSLSIARSDTPLSMVTSTRSKWPGSVFCLQRKYHTQHICTHLVLIN